MRRSAMENDDEEVSNFGESRYLLLKTPYVYGPASLMKGLQKCVILYEGINYDGRNNN